MNESSRTIDLRNTCMDEWDDLWDALAGPLDLPTWFGRNLDAWWDTIESGDVSGVLDRQQALSGHVRIDVADGTAGTGEGPPVH